MPLPTVQPAPTVQPVAAVQPEQKPEVPIVVHVRCAPFYSSMIRVWQSTFLLDCDSAFTSELVGFEKISLYPDWYRIPLGQPHVFTLFFQPMPRSVKVFDLSEIIPEPLGWHFPRISRNKEDVYWLDLPNG